MKHEKLKGGLTISRPRGGQGADYIELSVSDELSGSRFVSVRVSLEGFAEALMGLAQVDCEFDLRPDLVGMIREHKEEFVLCENTYANGIQRDRIAREALAPFEVDGWKGRTDDLFNQHRRGKDGARVTFVRYVEQEEAK